MDEKENKPSARMMIGGLQPQCQRNAATAQQSHPSGGVSLRRQMHNHLPDGPPETSARLTSLSANIRQQMLGQVDTALLINDIHIRRAATGIADLAIALANKAAANIQPFAAVSQPPASTPTSPLLAILERFDRALQYSRMALQQSQHELEQTRGQFRRLDMIAELEATRQARKAAQAHTAAEISTSTSTSTLMPKSVAARDPRLRGQRWYSQSSQPRPTRKAAPRRPAIPQQPALKPSEMPYNELVKTAAYKRASRQWTGLIVGIPVLVAVSYAIYEKWRKQQVTRTKELQSKAAAGATGPGAIDATGG